MAQVFIPGWNTTITIDTDDFTVFGNVLGFTRTKASLPKPVFGSQFRNEVPGQAGGSISVQGHVSVSGIIHLNDAFDSQTSVPYIIQVGDAAGPTDAGQFAGDLVVSELTLDTDAEGEWEFTMACTLDGTPAYTPPTP